MCKGTLHRRIQPHNDPSSNAYAHITSCPCVWHRPPRTRKRRATKKRSPKPAAQTPGPLAQIEFHDPERTPTHGSPTHVTPTHARQHETSEAEDVLRTSARQAGGGETSAEGPYKYPSALPAIADPRLQPSTPTATAAAAVPVSPLQRTSPPKPRMYDKIAQREREAQERARALRKGGFNERRDYDALRRQRARDQQAHRSKLLLLHAIEQQLRAVEDVAEDTFWDHQRLVAMATAREERMRGQLHVEHTQRIQQETTAATVIQGAYRRHVRDKAAIAARRQPRKKKLTAARRGGAHETEAENLVATGARGDVARHPDYHPHTSPVPARPRPSAHDQEPSGEASGEVTRQRTFVVAHSSADPLPQAVEKSSAMPATAAATAPPWSSKKRPLYRSQALPTRASPTPASVEPTPQHDMHRTPARDAVSHATNSTATIARTPTEHANATAPLSSTEQPPNTGPQKPDMGPQKPNTGPQKPNGTVRVYERAKRDQELKAIWRQQQLESARERRDLECTFQPKINRTPKRT